MTDRFDQLSARDTRITLLSLGRRIREALKPATNSARLRTRLGDAGPSGQSIHGLIASAQFSQEMLEAELVRSLDHQDPVLSASVMDADRAGSGRTDSESTENDADIETHLSALENHTQAAASRIEDANASSLSRIVQVAGHGQITPLGVGQEAARSGIASLNLIEKHVAWLRESAAN